MKGLLVLLSVVAIASGSPTSLTDTVGGATTSLQGALTPGGGAGGVAGGVPGVGTVLGGTGTTGNTVQTGQHLTDTVGGATTSLQGALTPGGGAGGVADGVPGVGTVLGGTGTTGGQQSTGLLGGLLGGGSGETGGLSDTLGGLFGDLVGGKRTDGHTDTGYKQLGYVNPSAAGSGLGGALSILFQGLTDHVGNAGSILDDVLHLRVPGLLDDGFNAVISVGRGVGGIIDALIPGLGSLLGNLVVSVGKLLICLLGSPGLTGSLLGRTPGQDNTRDIPYICTPDYGRNWGCSYNGPLDANSIINHYQVSNAQQQALGYINKFTNGQGVDSLTGSRKIVVTYILKLTAIMDKGSSNWSDADIKNIAIYLIIIDAALGDSYQQGLGVKIVDQLISTLDKNNKNTKFPVLSQYRSQIIAALNGSTEDSFNGAFNCDGGSDTDTNDDTTTSQDQDCNDD